MAKIFIEESTLSAIGDSIRAKTGKTDMISPLKMPTEIASIQAGGSSAPVSANDVTFYDYDGMIVASYTLEEAQALTALPDAPTHDGLTFQGWNWSLENVNTLIRSMNIGAMYITDDGKTRLHIHIADKARSTVPLYISQTVANGITIDWGDGSATETLAGTGNVNTSHAYGVAGDFTISLTVADGCTLGFGHNSNGYCVMGITGNSGKVYCNMLQNVEIGSGVTSIGNSAFSICSSLSSITIPDGVTSIGSGAFSSCSSISSITIPDRLTSIGSGAFSKCYGVAEYHLKPTTPPTLSNTSAFNNIPSDCIIYVPKGCLETYQNATNWTTYASHIQEEP